MRGPDFSYPEPPGEKEQIPGAVTQRDDCRSLWLFTWVVMWGSTLITLIVIRNQTSFDTLMAGIALAAIPALVALSMLIWLDRHEPEPTRWLWFAGGWGIGISGLAAIILNSTLKAWLKWGGVPDPDHVSAIYVAPVVEEFLKCLGLAVIAWAIRREFNGVIDALVYSGFIGIGFAAIENVLYFSYALLLSPLDAVGSFITRAIVSPFAHPFFTCIFGITLGLSAHRNGASRFYLPLAGFCGSVMAHSAWNYYAVVQNGTRFKAVYLTVLAPVFAAIVLTAVLSRYRQGRLVAKHAQGYTRAGWFTAAELDLLTSYQTRTQANRWVRGNLDPPHHTTIRTFVSMMGDLAALRDRINRDTAPSDAAARERVLLHAMVKTRPVLTAALCGIGKTSPDSDAEEHL